jgi:hypothetical protein
MAVPLHLQMWEIEVRNFEIFVRWEQKVLT